MAGKKSNFNPDETNLKNKVVHMSGSAGGMLVGNRHSKNGIKAYNKSTGQALEMEGGEVVITRNAVADTELKEFEGEMLTNRQILSRINEDGGGVSFADGGELPDELNYDEKEYQYGGQTCSAQDILYAVGNCGCQHMESGGELDDEWIEDINEYADIFCKDYECDGSTRVLTNFLRKREIPFKAFAGSVTKSKNGKEVGSFAPHLWIETIEENPKIIDFKTQMWLGKDTLQGVFPKNNEQLIYDGQEINIDPNIAKLLEFDPFKLEDGGKLDSVQEFQTKWDEKIAEYKITKGILKKIEQYQKYFYPTLPPTRVTDENNLPFKIFADAKTRFQNVNTYEYLVFKTEQGDKTISIDFDTAQKKNTTKRIASTSNWNAFDILRIMDDRSWRFPQMNLWDWVFGEKELNSGETILHKEIIDWCRTQDPSAIVKNKEKQHIIKFGKIGDIWEKTINLKNYFPNYDFVYNHETYSIFFIANQLVFTDKTYKMLGFLDVLDVSTGIETATFVDTGFPVLTKEVVKFYTDYADKYQETYSPDDLQFLDEVISERAMEYAIASDYNNTEVMENIYNDINKLYAIQYNILEKRTGRGQYLIDIFTALTQNLKTRNGLSTNVKNPKVSEIITKPEFLNWFGNYKISDGATVSKAVDKFGNPQLYYHGATREKYTYRPFGNNVMYLAEKQSYAQWFSENASAIAQEGKFLYSCYVSIKNPIDLTPFHVKQVDLSDLIWYMMAFYPDLNFVERLPEEVLVRVMAGEKTNITLRAWNFIRNFGDFNKYVRDNTDYDGYIYYENNPADIIDGEENVTKAVAVFQSNQVKLQNATIFSKKLDDFRFEKGGVL